MVLVGLLLIAAAAGFTIDVFAQNTAPVDVDVLGRTFAVDTGWLVVAGAVAVAVFLVGARLVVAGMARARGRRAALRTAQHATRERDQLAQQLAVERAERDSGQEVKTEYDARSSPAPDVPSDRT
nr:hypothetical protein [Actinomycetota bacterium]